MLMLVKNRFAADFEFFNRIGARTGRSSRLYL